MTDQQDSDGCVLKTPFFSWGQGGRIIVMVFVFPAAQNWMKMRIPVFHVSLWGWCPWECWTRTQGISTPFPAFPSLGCAMWRPDIIQQHLCVGEKHYGSCLHTSQMLTQPTLCLSSGWWGQGEKRQWEEFYRTHGFPIYPWPQRVSNACVFTRFFFSWFIFPTRLGNSISQHILPILICQTRFSNYISQYIRDVNSSIELHANGQLSQIQIMQLHLEFH